MPSMRRAAIIGVNKYRDQGIPELKGAENDAAELRQRLTNKDSGLFFEIAEGHFLRGEAATCDAVRQTISDLLWKTDSSDLSLFYFTGHGFHDEYGNGYIAPWDMRAKEPLVRGIRMQELTELLVSAKKKKAVVLILDCCYSGIASAGKSGSIMEKPRVGEWFSQLNQAQAGEGRIVFASGGKNEKSHELLDCSHILNPEGQGPHAHGAFTFHLLEGLDGKAATGQDAAVNLDGLMKYVEDKME